MITRTHFVIVVIILLSGSYNRFGSKCRLLVLPQLLMGVHGWFLLPKYNNERHHWLHIVHNDNKYHFQYSQNQFFIPLRQSYNTHRLNSFLRDDHNNDVDNATPIEHHHHYHHQEHKHNSNHRRQLLLYTSSIYTSILLQNNNHHHVAYARGLVQFPCTIPLANTYNLMRVGCTLLEEEGIWSTNPLFLTNRDDALSPKGVDQVVDACQLMQQDERRLPTLVKYSLAASCIDTAMIVGHELKLGTDRLVPEFTFLDPRAIGDWDMSARNVSVPAVWAMDNDEAGVDGLHALPPSSDDGTPHEVLADQAVRLRQVLSILESQYSGDTILLIFPDGTGPALLSAMIAGIPYNRVHELEYQSGEIRFDVTMDSTLELWKQKKLMDGESYQAIINEGRTTLKEFRAIQKRGGSVTNLKDQRIEEERIAIENEYRKKQQQRIDTERQYEETLRLNRQREVAIAQQNGSELQNNFFNNLGTQTALGIVGIAGTGVTAWRFGSTTGNVINTNSTDVDVTYNNNQTTNNTLHLDAKYDILANEIAHTEVPNRNGSTKLPTSTTVFPVLDPKERARIAMEEYMNRDDGAEDWIRSLSEIIDESTNDEDDNIISEITTTTIRDSSTNVPNVTNTDEMSSLSK